jgi:hypothetical protein
MKLRLPVRIGDGGKCTPMDHVYPSTTRGTMCYCVREWGVEPKRAPWAFLQKGKVKRTVRSLNRFKTCDVLFLRECGHVVAKHRLPGKVWGRVRCRMCERMAREVRKDYRKRQRKEAKRQAKAQRLLEKLLKRKRIRIHLKRKS